MSDRLERPEPEDILLYKEYLKTRVHGVRIEQQKHDDKYYFETFDVRIEEPYHITRTGTAARIVDSIADHIVTTNPVVIREPHKKTEDAKESAIKISQLLNNWVKILIDPIEESIKNLPRRGEGWYQLDFTPESDYYLKSCPIAITSPDPVCVFSDPVEYHGIPIKVIKTYRASPGVIKALYPDWEGTYESTEEVEYTAYWDKDWRYAECEGQVLIPVQPNIFGFVPFVHFYSGFGKSTPDARPEDKAVGRLTKIGVRSMLVDECEVNSQLGSIIALHANPYVLVEIVDPDAEIDPEEIGKLPVLPGTTFVTPYGTKATIVQGTQPGAEIFHRLDKIQAKLGLEVPPITSGVASGPRTSGRLEDILGSYWKRKNVRMTHNSERGMEMAFGLSLRALEKIPGLLPLSIRAAKFDGDIDVDKEITVTKDDIDGYYACKVELRPDKEIEEDRNVILGDKLVAAGRISWKRFLIQYMGYTTDEAENEINEVLAEKIMLTNPVIADIVGREALEKQGLQRYVDEMDAKAKMEGQARSVLASGALQAGMGSRPSEAQDTTNRDTVRQMLETPTGVRESPSGEGR